MSSLMGGRGRQNGVPFHSTFHFDSKKWNITFHFGSIYFPQNGMEMEWKGNRKGMEKNNKNYKELKLNGMEWNQNGNGMEN